MPASLENVPTERLLASLKLLHDADPLAFYRPASPEQQDVIRCEARGMLVLGGNRSGKTMSGAVRTCALATGRQVAGRQFRRCSRIWCISQELPSAADRPHTQVEAIRRWMPVAALRGQSWPAAYSPGSYTLTLADGCKIEFKSYDQDMLAFESAAVDHCWFDEEPTRRQIYTSCMLRLVDRRGTWDMTLTPVLSLEGKGWVEDLWEHRDDPECGYECLVLPTTGNRYLPQDEVARTAAGLAEEERQVRLYGAFARLGGRVLSEFDPRVHVCEDFRPPREWRHYLLIDPGWRTAAVLYAAADREGDLWLYDEVYVHQQRPDQIMPIIAGLREVHGRPDYRVMMDPAGFPPKRFSTGHEAPSDAQEYVAAARELGADWFRPSPADNDDSYAWRVKRYLAARKLHVCRSLKWWQWEQERWTRQKEREGPAAMERAVPDAPIDRNNHLMDCVAGDTLIAVERQGRIVQVPVTDLGTDNRVLTRDGCRKILAHWRTGAREVYRVDLSDGRSLTATGNHPIWVEERGWRDVAQLQTGDVVQSMPAPRWLSGAGSGGTVTPTPAGGTTGDTSDTTETTYTSRYGSRLGEAFRKAARSIIVTVIRGTTRWRTLSASSAKNTGVSMQPEALTRPSGSESTSTRRARPQVLGTPALKAESGIGSRRSRDLLAKSSSSLVATADRSSRLSRPAGTSSAPTTARPRLGGCREWMMRIASALTAGQGFGSTATTSERAAPVSVLAVSVEPRRQVVWNLQVEGVPEFYANGILVHNCCRYLCNELPLPEVDAPEPLTAWEQHWARVRAMGEPRKEYV